MFGRPLPRILLFSLGLALVPVGCGGGGAPAPGGGPAPQGQMDLQTLATVADLLRLHGSVGSGATGVPVCGGFDCDGDGPLDFAMASFRAAPLGRGNAGVVYLVFGDGTVSGTHDTGVVQNTILQIFGDEPQETAGNEIWMDDVTGDGVGDLLIARQNFTLGGTRTGCGALTVLVGGAALRAQAATLNPVDLRAPPAALTLLTIVGAAVPDRLGIWMRTGDVDGDGTADIVVGADQESGAGQVHRGVAYVIRGGAHLNQNVVVDLADLGATVLAGHIARIEPPPNSAEFHFGATVQIADIDGNDRAEVLIAAALARAGAGIPPQGGGVAHTNGGSTDGTLFIAWDDNFPVAPWPNGFTFAIDQAPGARTVIRGGFRNFRFGEEILGGLDYDNDGRTDLFVGDITGDGTGARPSSGMAHVLFDAPSLRGLDFDLDAPPPGLAITTFFGAFSNDIAGDTAVQGDFDDDGIDDFAFSSPHRSGLGRVNAGALHVVFGQPGAWPTQVDLRNLPPSTTIRITEIFGANGTAGADAGDVLAYSAAAADIDGDGRTDIITNEMTGNGLQPNSEDVGNLIIIGGAIIDPP